MFTEEEIVKLQMNFNIKDNKENILLYMDSKATGNQWLIVDFSEKFEERYGVYLKAKRSKVYKEFNQVKALANVMNLISSFETKKEKKTKISK